MSETWKLKKGNLLHVTSGRKKDTLGVILRVVGPKKSTVMGYYFHIQLLSEIGTEYVILKTVDNWDVLNDTEEFCSPCL
jgi:hypothetical protein